MDEQKKSTQLQWNLVQPKISLGERGFLSIIYMKLYTFSHESIQVKNITQGDGIYVHLKMSWVSLIYEI